MIDNQLLDAYIAELEALRNHGRDFASAHPDIAADLDIGPRRSRDPHVERVVDSIAFLAARMRLMIEEDSTQLPLAMLAMLAPSVVEPVPSMSILEFTQGSEEEHLAKGSRFDFEVAGQAMACFSTTMDATLAPVTLGLRRMDAGAGDAISIQIRGTPSDRLLLNLGNDPISSATIMDAIEEDLVSIELVPRGGGAIRLPTSMLRVHGFTDGEAALPVRPAAHSAHRVIIEFMAFPEKFAFVSLHGLPLEPGSEIVLRFGRQLSLPPALPPDLISTNRVPVVNLWQAAATPFDINGRQLEYPVRVDALRYRTVECHSVENVDIHGPDGDTVRIDPVVAFGNVTDSDIRWGVRRGVSRMGGALLMYFDGLDYSELGRERYLAAPNVLASNRDIAHRVPLNRPLRPVEPIGDWRCTVATAPSAYLPALSGVAAMERLIGYLRSSMTSLENGSVDTLRTYLQHFPGASKAAWIRSLGPLTTFPVAAMRMGYPQPGIGVDLVFDKLRNRTTSTALLKRVIGLLLESQRGINRVQNVAIREQE